MPVQTNESFRISDRTPARRHGDQKKARVTIETAVAAYLRDARSRELESSTLSKLEGIFRKQFLTWCTSEGYKFLDEIDLDALLLFRDTWIDGPLAKRKKQERLIGFFWACVRRGYTTEKHYSPRVKARQLQLQHSVRNAWPVEAPKPTISANNRRRLKRRASTVNVLQSEATVTKPSVHALIGLDAWSIFPRQASGNSDFHPQVGPGRTRTYNPTVHRDRIE
jgi:hypothetical protein